MLGHQLGDRVRVKALAVAARGDGDRARQCKALKRSEIRRFLDQHAVTRLEQHHRQERERLLRAAGDQQVLGAGVKPADG